MEILSHGKKKYVGLLITALILLVVSLSGCGGRSVGGGGDMVSRAFQVNSFSELNISIPSTIIWQESQQDSVNIEMQENLFEHLQLSVRGNSLTVTSSRPFETTGPNVPRIYITSPQITSLSSDNAITTEGWDKVNAPSFSLNISGGALIDIPLDVSFLEVVVDDGGASITLIGNADNTSIVVNGGVTISALDLQTADTSINLTGGGVIGIAVSNSLDVDIEGAGIISYRGNPTVTRNITGFGSVSRVE